MTFETVGQRPTPEEADDLRTRVPLLQGSDEFRQHDFRTADLKPRDDMKDPRPRDRWGCRLLIQPVDGTNHLRRIEWCNRRFRGIGQRLGQIVFVHKASQGTSERTTISGWHKQAGNPVGYYLPYSADIRRHHWKARGHGLNNHPWEPFALAAQSKSIGGAKQLRHILAGTEERHDLAQPELFDESGNGLDIRAPAHNQEMRSRFE
jgi:hypothetical protein